MPTYEIGKAPKTGTKAEWRLKGHKHVNTRVFQKDGHAQQASEFLDPLKKQCDYHALQTVNL